MLGSRILQQMLPVKTSIGPCWGMDRFYWSPLFLLPASTRGESIMVPFFGAAIANEGMLPKNC